MKPSGYVELPNTQENREIVIARAIALAEQGIALPVYGWVAMRFPSGIFNPRVQVQVSGHNFSREPRPDRAVRNIKCRLLDREIHTILIPPIFFKMTNNAGRFQEVIARVEDQLSRELSNEFQHRITMLAEALATADAQTLVGYLGVFYFRGDAPPDINGYPRDPIAPAGAWLMWQGENTVSLWLPQFWRG